MSKPRNALKHGAHASEVLLWSEKYLDYDALRTGLKSEYSPDGVTEHYLVRTLGDLLWRRRRLDVYEQIDLQRRQDTLRAKNEQGRHIDYMKSIAPNFDAAKGADEVEALLSHLEPIYRNTIRSHYPLQDGEDPAAWGPRIARALSCWTTPERHEGADEFILLMDLDKFDGHLARCERLDAAIDRIIKRLLQLKAQKQIHRRLEPKLINGTTEPAE